MTSLAQQTLEQGHAYLQSFDFSNAEKSYQQLLKRMPESSEALLSMARLQLLKSNPKRAKFFAKRASMFEHKGESQALLGACALQEGEIQRALDILQAASEQYPKHPLVLTNLGKALYQQGQYFEAKEVILAAKEQGALPEETAFDLAIICEELDQPKEAITHYTTSIQANSTFLPSYIQLSRLFSKAGKIEKAIFWLEKGAEEMPNLVQVKEELYGLYFFQGQPEKAMEQAAQIALQRGIAADYLRIGNTCLYLNKMEEAREAYEYAIHIEPDSVYAHINLGHWFRIHKQRDEALDSYCTATEKDDSYAKSYLGLALVFIELDQNFAKARYFLLRAVERDINDFDVLMHLAICSSKLKLWEEAIEVAERAKLLCHSKQEQERVETFLSKCERTHDKQVDC